MITDGTFKFSDEQDLSSPELLGSGTALDLLTGEVLQGTLSTDYYDLSQATNGGREQYVHVHVDESITATGSNTLSVAIRLVAWGSTVAAPTAANYGLVTLDVSSLLLPANRLTAGTDLYLPLATLSRSQTGTATNFTWKWLNVMFVSRFYNEIAAPNGASAVAGKVTTALTDAISNKPRVFSAQNDT